MSATVAISEEQELRELLMRPGDIPVVVVWVDPGNQLCGHYRGSFESAAAARDDFVGAVVDVTSASLLFDQLEYASIPMTTAFWHGQKGPDAAGDLGAVHLQDFLDTVVEQAARAATGSD